MRIIERLEIHRFRSFGDESILADEINVFSGMNNSGKSNVLRALNLFFNFETSYDSPHVFDKDYNKAYTGQAGGAREIIIKIHFLPQGNGALQHSFSIARSFKLDTEGFETIYGSSDPVIQLEIENRNGRITREFTRFLNSIEFFYIPAVRDKLFVQSLFQNFDKIARDTAGQEIKDKVKELSIIVGDRSQDISNEFESFLQLPTKATLSSNTSDIFGALQVEVQSGLQIRKKVKGSARPSEIVGVPVNLFSSGDGVLMSYIAFFLAHLCRKNPGKKYVWGFEEPENSLEYSKVQNLATQFLDNFKQHAQIFITTHSPAFISLRHREGVSFYRVYIEPNSEKDQPDKRLSRVKTLAAIESLQQSLFGNEQKRTEYEILEKEMGFIELSYEIQTAVNELIAKKQDFYDKSEELENQLCALGASFPEKVLIIEDTSKFAERFWKKVLIENNLTDVKIFCSEGCTNNRVEEHLRFKLAERRGYKPRVFRQIDKDGMSLDQIRYLEERHSGIVGSKYPYAVCALPVYELENFVITSDDIAKLDEGSKERVRDSFENTALSKLYELSSKYPTATDGLFKKGNNPNPVMQAMRSNALKSWSTQMPGKDIAASINNFKTKEKLSSLGVDDYSPELVMYVDKIKKFFMDSVS